MEVFYIPEESIAVAGAWEAVMTNALIGTDQTDVCFWERVLGVYNRFKPPGTVERTHGQIWKKFSTTVET